MTSAPPPSSPASSVGWAVARADGTVVSADEVFASLLGAPGGSVLVGRAWPSLVASSHTSRVADAVEALSAGRSWRGVLDFVFMTHPTPLEVEVFGSGVDAQGLVVLRASRLPEASPGVYVDETSVTLATTEATRELADAAAAARAVLQAVHQAVLLDWAVVLRFVPAGAQRVAAEVLSTYPSAMAGVERGTRWSPLDRAERAVYESGEPALEGEISRDAGDASPLGRLPAFGLRSSLHMPLYTGGRVSGCVIVYSLRAQSYTAADGIRLERFVRPLGSRLGGPALPAPGAGREPVPPPPPAPAPPPPPAPEPPSEAESSETEPRPAILAPAAEEPPPSPSAEPPAEASSAAPGTAPERRPVTPFPTWPAPPLPPRDVGTRPERAEAPEAAPPAEPAEPAQPAEQPAASAPPEPDTVPEPETVSDAAPADEPSAPAQDQGDAVDRQMRRLDAISEVVAGVAHELNNPLTAILGYAQILPTLVDDERRQALATIEQQSLRASRVVRNLLAFARQQRPTIQPVDLEAILRRVAEVRRQALEAQGVQLETRFVGLPRLRADEYQMEQVFLNLVNNAQQALPEGGRVTIATRLIEDRALFYVTDSGPGIPPELAERVFEPFFTTREGAGGGMGLAIVYGIVAEHGGRVWVEPGPEGGAQFVVELPLPSDGPRERGATSPPEADVPQGPPSVPGRPESEAQVGGETLSEGEAPADSDESDLTEASPGLSAGTGHRVTSSNGNRPRAPRVLVVDDEMPVRSLAAEILRTAGYEVAAVSTSEEALQLLDAESCDLLVANARLVAASDGSLYREAVTRRPALRGRLVVVGGDGEAGRAGIGDASGVRYLEKPFSAEELLRAAGELLAAQ